LLPLNTSPAPNADALAIMARFADSRQAWVNLSCHGSDEQMFGAKQQVPTFTAAGPPRKRLSAAWAYDNRYIMKLYWRVIYNRCV
jgi:hypothetical protein